MEIYSNNQCTGVREHRQGHVSLGGGVKGRERVTESLGAKVEFN